MQLVEIAWPDAAALVWDGDDVLDVTSGQRGNISGVLTSALFRTAYRFDRAIGLRKTDVHWAIAYTNRGTKALLMKNGSIHRELNRSFYFAGDYDYPIALGEDPLGSILVFHCPNKFDLLEIEDAESGKQIDTLRSRDMEFHSRLGLSPNGRFLIDAGWFWHPWCGAAVLEIVHTDEGSIRFCKDAIFAAQDEIQSISFMEDARLIISSALNYFGEKPRPGSLGPKQLGNWSINDRRWESIADLNEPTGPIMPWKEWVVSFYEHPKLIELTTGKIVHQWERIYCGKQIGPIELGDPVPPPMAFDPLNGRFAVADSKTVTIVTL